MVKNINKLKNQLRVIIMSIISKKQSYSKNGLIILTVFTILILLGSALAFGITINEDSDDNSGKSEIQLVRTRADPEPKEKTLDTFSTGTNKFTVVTDKTGRTVNLALPPDAVVTSADLSMEGKIKRSINQYQLGGRPAHVNGADFNNDGNQDILAADLDTHSLYLLLGTGDLRFGSLKRYQTGDLPLWTTINDFNNDGYLDTAISNEGANTITVYQNSGDSKATLTNRKDYKIGDIPRSITSGDFDGDGWLDLASVSSNDDKLWINFNQKSSQISFDDAVNYTVDRSPVGLTSGDINMDGHQDIIVIHVGARIIVGQKQYTDSVSVFLNNGTGEFLDRVDYIVGKKVTGVVIDDFNSDGWPDIATSNYAGYEISILLNRAKGNGYMNNAVNYSLNDNSSSGINLRSGDIDGDGDIDIVSVCPSLNHLEIIRNNGDGTFQAYEESIAGHSPNDIYLNDFDNDGDLDVATGNLFDGSVSIHPNNGDGVFTTFDFYYVGGWPRGIDQGDIDNDGDIDIITANYLGGSLSIRYNNGNGKFPVRYDRHIAVEPFAVIVEDIDKDSFLDLASADEGLFELVFIFNDGDGNFKKREKVSHALGGYPYFILYHDFNNDGLEDLITSNNLQQSISILWNIGNQSGDKFSPFVNYSFANQHPFGIEYGDMDGDGDDDLLCTNHGFESAMEDFISIIWNNGNSSFGSFTNYKVGANPIDLQAADLDSDGDLDLAVANKDDNSTTLLFNDNNESLGNRIDYPAGGEPMSIEVVDFNYDGHLDIIVANHENDSFSIMYNKGDGTFTHHIEYPNGPQPTYMSITDFNGDGNLDIAASNKLTSSISVHLDLHHPEDITVYVGESDTPAYEHTGVLKDAKKVQDLATLINAYLSAHQSDSVDTLAGTRIMVPLEIVAEKAGIVELIDLEIKYHSTKDYDEDNIPDDTDDDDDNDGLPDTWEDNSSLDPMDPDDANVDTDNDNLTNLEEYQKNTNPGLKDTDGDGLNDGVEVQEHGTDPTAKDSDGDGYSDGLEIDKETDPLDKDDNPGDEDDAEEEGSDVCLAPFYTFGIIGYAIIMMIFLLIIAALAASRKKKAD
jgi:hypothetical protein